MKNMLFILLGIILVLANQGCRKKDKLDEARRNSPNMDTTTQEIQDFSSALKDPDNLEESLLSRTRISEDELSAEIKKIYQNIHFDYDKFEIRQEDLEILNAIAAHMESNPKINVQIEGHTDEAGSREYNIALGEKRANVVLKFFTAYGIKEDRFSTISYGEERPIVETSKDESHPLNRRAQFNIMK
jgi:peptidoglycan-associated lipoprotein